MASPNKFLYFGYGSNLLRERIHIRNPTAVFKCIGKLDGYKLDFDTFGTNWNGALATITPSPERHVWGVVWEIDVDQMHNLDRQEGVDVKEYEPIEVNVMTTQWEPLVCRCYSLLKRDAIDKRPSPQYLNVIVHGAKENNLPADYIKMLESIETNGHKGKVEVEVSINKDL